MKRREFITLLGGAAAWPLAARAQQPAMRRVGVLMHLPPTITEAQLASAAFRAGLAASSAGVGRNIAIDIAGPAIAERLPELAAELVALAPDVIIVAGGGAAAALPSRRPRLFRSCFAPAIDPVGAGLVASLGAAGRQRHRLHAIRVRAWRQSGSSCSRSSYRSVTRVAVLAIRALARRHRAMGVIKLMRRATRRGVDSDFNSRRQRDRTRHCRIRARLEWRPDRALQLVGDHSPAGRSSLAQRGIACRRSIPIATSPTPAA